MDNYSPLRLRKIPRGRNNLTIGQGLRFITPTLFSTEVEAGERVAEVEKQLGEMLGRKHVLYCSSCRMAFFLALKGVEVQPWSGPATFDRTVS